MSTDKSDPSTAQGDTDIEELRQIVEQQQNRINELEQRQQTLNEQHQQVTGLFEQFKTGKISRRAFLTSVSALAGVGYLAGSAQAATPDWSNASGYAGTESTPLTATHASEGTFETANIGQIENSGSAVSLPDGLSTPDATIGPNVSGGVNQIGTLGSGGFLYGSDRFSVSDDATSLITSTANGQVVTVLIRNGSTNESAALSVAGTNVTINESVGSWAVSDTDGNNCVFVDANDDLVVKNRTGTDPVTYDIAAIKIGF